MSISAMRTQADSFSQAMPFMRAGRAMIILLSANKYEQSQPAKCLALKRQLLTAAGLRGSSVVCAHRGTGGGRPPEGLAAGAGSSGWSAESPTRAG